MAEVVIRTGDIEIKVSDPDSTVGDVWDIAERLWTRTLERVRPGRQEGTGVYL